MPSFSESCEMGDVYQHNHALKVNQMLCKLMVILQFGTNDRIWQSYFDYHNGLILKQYKYICFIIHVVNVNAIWIYRTNLYLYKPVA